VIGSCAAGGVRLRERNSRRRELVRARLKLNGFCAGNLGVIPGMVYLDAARLIFRRSSGATNPPLT